MGQRSEMENGIVCEHSPTRAEQRPSQSKENVATALSSPASAFSKADNQGELLDYSASPPPRQSSLRQHDRKEKVGRCNSPLGPARKVCFFAGGDVSLMTLILPFSGGLKPTKGCTKNAENVFVGGFFTCWAVVIILSVVVQFFFRGDDIDRWIRQRHRVGQGPQHRRRRFLRRSSVGEG